MGTDKGLFDAATIYTYDGVYDEGDMPTENTYVSLSALDSLQGDKVLEYLGLYQKKNLYQKAGFILSKLGVKGLGTSFFEACERNIGTAWVDLCATGEEGDKDARWRVKAPKQSDYDY